MTDWPCSSYADYIGLRNGALPASHAIMHAYTSQAAYREFVEQGAYEADEAFNQWLLQQNF